MTKRYKVLEKNHQWKDLSVEEISEGRFEVVIGNKRLSLEPISVQPPLYTFLLQGKELLEVEIHSEENDTITAVNLGHYPHRFHVVAPSQAALENESDSDGPTGGKVIAPMPGKVVEIKVKVGDTVSPGQGVIVVEAMKMQNELVVQGKGSVEEIKVTVGQIVDGGQLLIVIRG